MIGEISIGGVFFPTLVVLGVIALILTAILSRLLQLVSAYRLVAYRPLVDVALFMIFLGLLAFFTIPFGPPV